MPENKLISHVKDANGAIHATLVALSPTNIGIAVRRPDDACNKKRAISIAETRANIGKAPALPNRMVLVKASRFGKFSDNADVFEPLAEILEEEYYALRTRAENYFKSQSKQLDS